MKIEPKVLENRFVRLEPMAERHREQLREACNADQQVWMKLYPFSWGGDQFEPTWATLTKHIDEGSTVGFAVVVDGRCVGLTCFSGMDRANGVVEVGGTYYRPDVRGGAVNPAAKRLMMGHAFDSGARRVVYRVDAINARSRAAVLKLGATQEGILRQDRITWTGRVRDTVIFSVLEPEWPRVQQGLDARLAAFA